MGPSLALSALLLPLLLLLPPPSLCQDDGSDPGKSDANKTASDPAISPIVQSNQDPPAPQTTSTPLTKPIAGGSVAATLSPAQPTTISSKGGAIPSGSPTPTSALTPGSSVNQSGVSSTTTPSGSQDEKMNLVTPSSNTGTTSGKGQPLSSGGKIDNVTTTPASTQRSDQLTTNASSSQPLTPLTTSKSSASATNSTTSSHQPVTTPSHTTESPSTVSSSSGPMSSPDFSLSPRKPTTHTPLGTSKGTPPITSQIPGFSTLSLSTPQQTTGSPVGTEIMSTTEEFPHSSSNLTPTAPQGPSMPSPDWTFRDYKLKCEAAIMPSEELLILNLTGASLCEGSPPDEKLMELLCHSVKASFKPAQDQCTLQLAPILESRAVAVKRVIIETKLSPEVVFERLKDKWDDLREAGVSNMMLGREGPPEANEDRFSLPLIITIVCMASFLLLVAALYGCCHQRVSQRKDQQRLTEELQTVENGYHDNPTLEVMETPSEMQEKKVVSLNGELGDSWIVPLDNLTKDDLDEEEDTHL